MTRRRALLAAGAAFLPLGLHAQPVPPGGRAGFHKLGPGALVVPGGGPPSLDMSFLTATLDPSITWTRANNNATDGLFTAASGASFNTFLANIPRINTTNGLLIEPLRANNLLNSSAPVTQTTASLGVGTYWLWVNGSGSATPSAGTATGAGFAAATQGAPSTFTISVAGTVVVTVSGSLNRFQLEAGGDASSYIPTLGTILSRQIDSGTLPTAGWFNAAEGTVVVDFMQPTVNATNGGNLPSLWTDLSNAIQFVIGQVLTVQVWSGNVSQGSFASANTITAGIVQRSVYTYVRSTRAISLCLNGGPVVTGTAGAIPSFTQIKFGAVRNGAPGGFIRRLRFYPRAMPPAEQQAVSA